MKVSAVTGTVDFEGTSALLQGRVLVCEAVVVDKLIQGEVLRELWSRKFCEVIV